MNLYYSIEVMRHFWNFENRPDFHSPPRRSVRRGFSLVETALALGVVSFALISLLGLLPGGLQTFRKAMDCTVQTEMTQVLISKANQMSYGDISSKLGASTYYFDDNGNLLDPADTASATYQANVTVTTAVTLPATSSNYSNVGIAQVTMTFSRKQAAATTPLSEKIGGTFGGLVSGFLLVWIHFDASKGAQTPQTLHLMQFFYFLFPFIGATFALIMISLYNITEDRAYEIKDELKRRNAAKTAETLMTPVELVG